jgi:2,3-bisphosphoglycerate-independent phosphoglycerate mutase
VRYYILEIFREKGDVMKYLFLVGDGMADELLPQLKNRTPLEASDIPNMRRLAREGRVGMCRTIPQGMPPGSDVANLSLLGFNPAECYTGRGPLEAAAIGIRLEKEDYAFRCNLVTVQRGKMKDYSAGHISTKEAEELISLLSAELADDEVRFYAGVDYRHICVLRGSYGALRCTPPHDITDTSIDAHLPEGEGSAKVCSLMESSKRLLKNSDVNHRRVGEGKLPATQIWLWGQGKKPELTSFARKFGVHGSVISAVDLVRGLGVLAGLEVIHVEGATGFVDTNYEGKADAALKSLEKNDFVFIHVEAPDEAGHLGNLELKMKAIEDLDRRLLGRLLKAMPGSFRILVMPDHPTPVRIKTHSADPVPFVLWGQDIRSNGAGGYSEREASATCLFVARGYELITMLFEP